MLHRVLFDLKVQVIYINNKVFNFYNRFHCLLFSLQLATPASLGFMPISHGPYGCLDGHVCEQAGTRMICPPCHCQTFNAKYDLPLEQWLLLGQKIGRRVPYSFPVQGGMKEFTAKGQT